MEESVIQKVQHALRIRGAFNRAVNHDLSWFEGGNSGNFQTVLGEDVSSSKDLDGGINDIIQIVVSTILVSCVLFINLCCLGSFVS